MYLFFDTETTGLPNYTFPDLLHRQPFIVQLAALLTDSDGRDRGFVKTLIRPDGWEIPAAATSVHGISTKDCETFGVPVRHALAFFSKLLANARVIVAHNTRFDVFVADVEMRRMGKFDFAAGQDRFCTMEASAPIVNLPPTDKMVASGMNKPKSPRLEECIRFFFDEQLEGSHDAMADTRACMRIFFELRRRQSEAKTAATA